MTDLLPCPFCGNDAHESKNELREIYFVGCDDCGANAGTVENWNRRVVVPAGGGGGEREAFERHFRPHWTELDKKHARQGDGYWTAEMNSLWEGWQARAALRTAPPAEPRPETPMERTHRISGGPVGQGSLPSPPAEPTTEKGEGK